MPDVSKYQDVVLAFAAEKLGYDNGSPVFRAQVRVERQDGTPAQLYSDNGITPATQPILTDSAGNFFFYVADGLYDIIVSDPFGMNPVRKSKVQIVDALKAKDAPAVIGPGQVDNSNLATMPAATLKGVSAAGSPSDLTAPIVKAILNLDNVQNLTPSQVLDGLTGQIVTSKLGYTPSSASALAANAGSGLVGSGDGRSVQQRLDATDQTIVAQPLANAGNTQTSYWTPIVGKSSNAGKREFGEVRSFLSQYGYGSGITADKAVSYRSMWASQGSSDAWTVNDLFHHSTNDPINTHLYELDYDITTKIRYGTTPGGAGLSGGIDVNGNPFANASAWGVFLTGISTQGGTITGGFGVGRAGDNSYFQRGFVAAVGCIQSGFEDDSDAAVAFRDFGSHIDGLNTAGALYSGSAVHMANGHDISALSTAGVRQTLLRLDGGNNLLLGFGPSINNVYVSHNVLPLQDNTIIIGSPGNRIKALYIADGVVQTSDQTLKTSITEMTADQTGTFIDTLQPRLAKWVVGGRKPIMGVEKQEIVTGFETLKDVEVRPAKLAEDGTVLREAMVQDVRSPITELRDVEVVTGYEDMPGKRLHGQTLAQSVKAAYEAAGFEDFGGHVVDEDGTEHVRPDEILVVALAELQFLRARMLAAEKRIAALEGLKPKRRGR